VKGDILVGADGFRSAIRGIVAPEIQPIYSGYVIWRAVIDEADLDPETHAAVFEKFTCTTKFHAWAALSVLGMAYRALRLPWSRSGKPRPNGRWWNRSRLRLTLMESSTAAFCSTHRSEPGKICQADYCV
jgi:2-polyprenyl-6-methoxyphenol hydroxylase-like FAD-dependent oxidoreductase